MLLWFHAAWPLIQHPTAHWKMSQVFEPLHPRADTWTMFQAPASLKSESGNGRNLHPPTTWCEYRFINSSQHNIFKIQIWSPSLRNTGFKPKPLCVPHCPPGKGHTLRYDWQHLTRSTPGCHPWPSQMFHQEHPFPPPAFSSLYPLVLFPGLQIYSTGNFICFRLKGLTLFLTAESV